MIKIQSIVVVVFLFITFIALGKKNNASSAIAKHTLLIFLPDISRYIYEYQWFKYDNSPYLSIYLFIFNLFQK